MATIIFDFDDTLFKTRKLKDSIFRKMESFGISTEIINKTYEICKKRFKYYTPSNHVFIINEMDGLNISEDQTEEINEIDFSFHKIEEIHNVLFQLSKKHHLVLLTIGDKDFQKLKIYNSGISSHFHEIHIISEKKEDFISSQDFNGDVYFINDKESENEIIRKMFPHINVIDFNINKGSLDRLPLDII